MPAVNQQLLKQNRSKVICVCSSAAQAAGNSLLELSPDRRLMMESLAGFEAAVDIESRRRPLQEHSICSAPAFWC